MDITIIGSKIIITMHTTRVAHAPSLKTRDGGLKIFYDWSTLPTHPVPRLSCIMIYTLHTLVSLGTCKNVVWLWLLLFKWVAAVMTYKYGMCAQSTRSRILGVLGDVLYISGCIGSMLNLQDVEFWES